MATTISHLYLTLVLLGTLLGHIDTVITYSDIKSDFETLLSAYEITQSGERYDIIPKNLTEGPLVINLGLNIHSVSNFDLYDGTIQVGGTLDVSWVDEVKDLANVTFKRTDTLLPVTKQQIWTPELVVVNGNDFIGKIGASNDVIRYNKSTGECFWEVEFIMKVVCTSNMMYFPYDKHDCGLTVRSWTPKTSDVQLNHLTNVWNTDFLEPSALWDVITTSTEWSSQTPHDAIFKMTIKRKSQFLSSLLFTPTLILSFMSLLVFVIPPFSQERVCFSVMCMVSFVVLLECLADTVPLAFFPKSLVFVYLFLMLILNILVGMVNIIMMRIHCRKYTGKVPERLQQFINVITCRPCKRCSQDEDVNPTLEKQDTVFNIRFPFKNINDDLNGEIIEEEEDSVFELSDDNIEATENARALSGQIAKQENAIGRVAKSQPETHEQSIHEPTECQQHVDTNDNSIDKSGNTSEDKLNESDKESISSMETTYTTQTISIKPTLVEETYTRSFNTYLPRSLVSNKIKTRTRHEVIGRTSRLGNKGQSRTSNAGITPVEHSQSMLLHVPDEQTEFLNEEEPTDDVSESASHDRDTNTVNVDIPKVTVTVFDKSDTGNVSSSYSKTDSDDGRTTSTRFSSSTKTRTTSTSSVGFVTKADEMTWSNVGHVLDIFFIVVFAVVQILFTIGFIIPMSTA